MLRPDKNKYAALFAVDNSSLLGAAQASASAARAVGAAKAGALDGNASLLRFDAASYRRVGADVFRNEVRQGLQRTASAGSQYVAGGVTLSGSAGAVMDDIRRESQREAIAQRNQYEFSARRSALQADIAEYTAGLERQAAAFQATAIVEQATAGAENDRNRAIQRYLDSNRAQYEAAFKVHPWSFSGGAARANIAKYREIASLLGEERGTLAAETPLLGNFQSSYATTQYFDKE